MSDELRGLFTSIGTVLLPSCDGAAALSIDALSKLLPSDVALFVLPCHFDEGGPWAGTRDLFRSVLGDLESDAPDLLAAHDYELVHVLPELKRKLGIRNPSLTDLASNEERVRNYPADRAIRIVHGLIDLLISFKEQPKHRVLTWLLVCIDYDSSGHMSKLFFQELMRRAGTRLRLILLPAGNPGPLDFSPTIPRRPLPFAIELPGLRQIRDNDQAAQLARALELEVSDDILASTGKIPELLRLWQIAGHQEKILEWQYKALHAFNRLGFYSDAIRYGEPLRGALQAMGTRSIERHWGIFFKLFICYTTTGDLESAKRIADEDVLVDQGNAAEAPLRIRLCYLMAMYYARYLPMRDFVKGEWYLEQGLAYLHQSRLPAGDHWFQFVFNRNGLAMIRSFQGRYGEALALCQQGYGLLEQHLDPGRHRLHRSVLLYNMAQVYTQIGELDLAIDQYTAAMRMDPNYSEYYNERGNAFLKLGKLDQAYRDYRRATELGPPYYEVWSNLGQCCRVAGRMEEAISAYDRALDLQPDQPMVLVVRAQALEALGRVDQAIDAYSLALRMQPTLWPAFAARAVLLYEQGKVKECLTDLDRAISLAPHEPEIYQNRAVALCDLGRTREASEDLQRYLELQPDAADRDEVEARLRNLSSPPIPSFPGATLSVA